VSAGESTAQVPVTDEPAASAIESLLTRLGNIESQRLRDSLAIVLDNDRETKPAFSSSWVLPIPPPQAQLVKSYPIGDAEVRLYRLPDRTESLYFVAPFEYSLDSRQLKLLCKAREELRALNPGKVELRTPQEARMYAVQVG